MGFFFPRIRANPQCLRGLACIEKYGVSDRNIQYASSTNHVMDEKKVLGPKKVMGWVSARRNWRKMKKMVSKRVVSGGRGTNEHIFLKLSKWTCSLSCFLFLKVFFLFHVFSFAAPHHLDSLKTFKKQAQFRWFTLFVRNFFLFGSSGSAQPSCAFVLRCNSPSCSCVC